MFTCRPTSLTITLYLLCALSGAAQIASAATISICPAGTEIHSGVRAQAFYSASGEQQLLLIGDEKPERSECASLEIPQNYDSIEWVALQPRQDGNAYANRITLQGNFEPNDVTVSEIIASAPRSTQQTSEVSEPQSQFEALTFGIEERASWINGERLECRAGEDVAGVQLRSGVNLPRNEQLHLLGSGTGEFQLLLADAAHIQNQSSIPLGLFSLKNEMPTTLSHFDIPQNSAPWIALTLLCPASAATVRIDRIDSHPPQETMEYKRSAWVWQPSFWQQSPEFFWRLRALEDIREFFITVPVNVGGEVSNAPLLRQFLREADSRNIRIWAVIGDRNDVLEENRGLLRTRVSAYRRFNERSQNEEMLAGVQLDIEPYLLPGHNLASGIWRERYLQTIRAAIDTAGESLPVDLVMPVWWGDHSDWGSSFLNRLDFRSSITVMNYRTDFERLYYGAIPFLDWGREHQRPVRIALETGTLEDETQRIYVASDDTGRLWSLQIGSTPILVLFETPQNNLIGSPYSFASERDFSAGTLTFAGDQQRLNTISDQLTESWRQWPTFTGIAVHGLDEIYAEK